jgi:hypothetical protein
MDSGFILRPLQSGRRVLILAALLLAPLPGALSAPAVDDDRAALKNTMNDPDEQQQVIRGAAKSQVLALNPCADASFRMDDTYAIYQPLSVDGSGAIVAGAWRQRVQEQGCGESHVLNVLVLARGAGNLAFVPVLPDRGGCRRHQGRSVVAVA